MSAPALRKRVASQPVAQAQYGVVPTLPAVPPPSATKTTISTALSRIMQGIFGASNPQSFSASNQVAIPAKGSFYNFHEGDVFTPGTQNYVFEPTTELTPLNTTWGMGFLRVPNTFSVRQPTPLEANPTIEQNGIGGLVPGQWVTQPLESEGT